MVARIFSSMSGVRLARPRLQGQVARLDHIDLIHRPITHSKHDSSYRGVGRKFKVDRPFKIEVIANAHHDLATSIKAQGTASRHPTSTLVAMMCAH